MADRSGAVFAAIIGSEEVAADTVTLRRLIDGAQEKIPADQVVAHLERVDA